jgi:ribonuclease HI
LIIYTDGGCSGNGKSENTGGFGVVVIDEDKDELLFAYRKLCENTTNNREELKAILYSLLKFGYNTSEPVIVYSDSAYCVNTFNDWMYSWARNGWIKSDKKTPENLDLIKEYYNYIQKGYKIDLRKIKGHAGHKWNELADKLATGKVTISYAYESNGKCCPIDQKIIEAYKGEI